MYPKLQVFNILGIIILSLIACQTATQSPEADTMVVNGYIDGLRKGTVFLQKVQDTVLITVDSTAINGRPEFQFKTKLSTPEIFFLYLNKEDGDSLNDRILFFGEPGTIQIKTLLKTFESSAKIKGSENQELLHEYKSFMRKFDDQNLSIYKDYFAAKQANDEEKADSLEKAMDNLLRRRYLYAINFAAQNTNQYIAPYIAITEVADANLKLLDTVAAKMTEPVKNSKYGKEFLQLIETRHRAEDPN